MPADTGSRVGEADRTVQIAGGIHLDDPEAGVLRVFGTDAAVMRTAGVSRGLPLQRLRARLIEPLNLPVAVAGCVAIDHRREAAVVRARALQENPPVPIDKISVEQPLAPRADRLRAEHQLRNTYLAGFRFTAHHPPPSRRGFAQFSLSRGDSATSAPTLGGTKQSRRLHLLGRRSSPALRLRGRRCQRGRGGVPRRDETRSLAGGAAAASSALCSPGCAAPRLASARPQLRDHGTERLGRTWNSITRVSIYRDPRGWLRVVDGAAQPGHQVVSGAGGAVGPAAPIGPAGDVA
jgi:hypothetical protein